MRFSMIFSCLGLAAYAIINYFVTQFRGKPVFPQDFYSIKTGAAVAGQYEWKLTVYIVVGILLAISLSAFWMKCHICLKPKTRLMSAAAVLLLATGIKLFAMEKNVGEVELNMWTPTYTFTEKGYALTFTYSLHILHPEKPEKYSEESVGQITGKYLPPQKDDDGLPQNVIVIMDESWTDLSVLGSVPVSSEEMPFCSALNDNVIKGSTYVSSYAGNTANSEFEFLTGNSVARLPQGAVAYQVCMDKETPSIVSWLSDLGYETVSYHPEKASNYNRKQVYSYLGFAESYWDDSFDDNEYVRWLISDSCDFRHVEEICKRKTSDKIFIFNVTAQNHAGFGTCGMPPTVTLAGDYSSAAVDEFLSLVQITDSAIEELISYFSTVDEKTVILIYGNHQPRLEQPFYNSTGYSFSKEKYDEKYITCYMLWANYDLPEDLGRTDMISVITTFQIFC